MIMLTLSSLSSMHRENTKRDTSLPESAQYNDGDGQGDERNTVADGVTYFDRPVELPLRHTHKRCTRNLSHVTPS